MTLAPKLRRITKTTIAAVILICILLVVAMFFQSTAPLTADEVRRRDDEINEAAAITVPHAFVRGKLRKDYPQLTQRVEQDRELSAADSAKYRIAFQEVIFIEQPILRRFDRNLTVLTNVEMFSINNVGDTGIAGSHDHHDSSVRSNLRDLQTEVSEAGNQSLSSWRRIRAAIFAYKDLSDTLVHLGTIPHTKSVLYSAANGPLGPYEQQGEAILRDFKTAQFAPVNSQEYWDAVWRGLDKFDLLALDVQGKLNESLSPLERHVAGRWGSAQSLGPWLTPRSRARRYRPSSGSSH
jgi:hypothetical protein